jgi:hypothetical protein
METKRSPGAIPCSRAVSECSRGSQERVGACLRVFTRCALAVIVTTAVLPIASGAAYAADATAAFDWEMPARTGLDANEDGVIDARVTRAQIDPASWQVNFNACGSTPSDGATVVRYRWLIDRYPIGNGGPQCGGFTYYFPEEGVYEVTLDILDSAGNEAHLIRDIAVQDFLVVALGDSYASGQGNPDVPILDSLLEDAEEARADYRRILGELGSDYEETERKVGVLRSRLIYLNSVVAYQTDVCDPWSSNANADHCWTATTVLIPAASFDLLTALLDLGGEVLDDTLGALTDAAEGVLKLVDDAREALDDAQAALSPVWQNKRCNRSAIAGQAQAALALEEADPHTSVTLVHLACSGATIPEGLIGPYAGVEPPSGAPDLPPQVERAADLIGGREVDAVLLSIGGNDVGFGPIVEACMFQEPCHSDNVPEVMAADRVLCDLVSVFDDDCATYFDDLYDYYATHPAPAATIFIDKKSSLPDNYATLAERLADTFPAIAADPGRVYITEYPNAVQDDDEHLCVSGLDNLLTMLPWISFGESQWLRDTVTSELNELVSEAAADHRWTLVDGIFDAYARHGYCSSQPWLRRIQDAFRMQGTKEGAVHPTAEGHEVYREGYLAALQAGLYQADGGVPNLNAPRLPNLAYAPGHDSAPPSVIGVPDRASNGAGWYSNDVTIDWQATDPAPSSGMPTDPQDTLASIEGSGVVYTSEASCDPTDRCATGTLALSIDKTMPSSVACQLPAPTFLLGATGATVSAAVSDALSGPATATVSTAADTTSVGAKTVPLTGLDLAGNATTGICPYTVAYVFGGFLSPVDEGGVLNVAQAGRGIPLKWRLTDASGAPVRGLTTASIAVQSLSCSAGTSTDLVEETTAGGSGLQNLGDGYYQLNWKTPSSYAGSCKTIRLDLGEGLVHTALFKFTK